MRATSSPPSQKLGTGRSTERHRDSVSVRRMHTESSPQHGMALVSPGALQMELGRAHLSALVHAIMFVLQDSPASFACVTAEVINSDDAVAMSSITLSLRACTKASESPAPAADRTPGINV